MPVIARNGVTVGIAQWVVISHSDRLLVRWARMPGRRMQRGEVISGRGGQRRISHSAAADSWLRTASGWPARTAAAARAIGSIRR